MAKTKDNPYRVESLAHLRKLLKPGTVVFTILRHVSSNGMHRRISLAVPFRQERTFADGRKQYVQTIAMLDWHAMNVLEIKRQKDLQGIPVGGCGMDMGFHLVYNLSSVLYPNGHRCAGQAKCCSNDHFNGDREYGPHKHGDGGYALKHSWL